MAVMDGQLFVDPAQDANTGEMKVKPKLIFFRMKSDIWLRRF